MEKSSELCFFTDLHYTAKPRVWQQGDEGLGEDICKRASVMVLKEQSFTLRTKTLKTICFAKQSAKNRHEKGRCYDLYCAWRDLGFGSKGNKG